MDLINWVFIITSGQGFFLSQILFFKKRKNPANRLLALLLFLLSIELCVRFNLYLGGSSSLFSLQVLIESFGFFYGPVIYGYTLFATTYKKKFSGKDIFHLVPALLDILYNLVYFFEEEYFLLSENEKFNFQNLYLTGGLDIYDYIIIFMTMISMLIYLIFSIKIFRRYSIDTANFFSDLTSAKLIWLKVILIVISICICGDILQTIGYVYHKSVFYYIFDLITYSVICVILYTAGYFALTQPEIFSLPDYITVNDKWPMGTDDTADNKNENNLKTQKYSRTRLPENVADEITVEIRETIENEKLYLDPELNLDDFSKSINTPPHHVSQVINSRFNQNFFMFINSYRITEAIKLLSDKNSMNKTILSIALESGFNSKTTFNLIFKKTIGMTPTEYRKEKTSPESI